MKSVKRPYQMSFRARSAEATRARILESATSLFLAREPDAVTLAAIAGGAGVTLQTVLRKFGSKDELFAAAARERARQVSAGREPAAPGPRAAVRALVASYEQLGQLNWRLLRYEGQQPVLGRILRSARRLHRDWVERSFADVLPRRGAARERRVDALFTVLDFYVWKLHRRDLGRSRAQTEAVMLGLVAAINRPQEPR